MKQEVFTYANTTENSVPAVIWLPDGEVKSVLQIVHGMTEHIGRYEQLAEALTREGIAVAGFDLRGHGQNGLGLACASFGESGWEATMKDIHQLHLFTRIIFGERIFQHI